MSKLLMLHGCGSLYRPLIIVRDPRPILPKPSKLLFSGRPISNKTAHQASPKTHSHPRPSRYMPNVHSGLPLWPSGLGPLKLKPCPLAASWLDPVEGLLKCVTSSTYPHAADKKNNNSAAMRLVYAYHIIYIYIYQKEDTITFPCPWYPAGKYLLCTLQTTVCLDLSAVSLGPGSCGELGRCAASLVGGMPLTRQRKGIGTPALKRLLLADCHSET